MPLSLRHFLSLAALSLGSGFFACREPTQITLSVTTDALCPDAALSAPRLVDAMFATGKTVDPKDFAAAALTDQCQSGDPNVVGTLVLLPGGDDLGVEVLVVAGVELAGPTGDIDPLRLSAEGCQALISAGGVGAIQGKPCILVRRRLGFVEHTKLELPIDLDTRCIGKKCGEDESCFKGNCVSLDVVCDETGCHAPITCEEKCDEFCASGASRCNDTTCECLPCDAATCSAACGLTQQVGVCETDELCLCKSCDQPACTDQCDGECSPVDASCGCATCNPTTCDGAGCSCEGSPEAFCTCVGDCDPTACAMQDCLLGQVGTCGETAQGEEACICSCDDDLCNSGCEFGGSCQPNGVCGCDSQCIDSECIQNCSIEWKRKSCFDGGCACICDEDACADACLGVPNLVGSHCTLPGDPAGVCQCDTSNPNGGGGQGGVGGSGGDGGFGGDGGQGGTPTTTTTTTTTGCSCAGVTCGPGQFCEIADNCTCECQTPLCQSFCQNTVGENGTCIGSDPGNCMCDPSTSTSGGPMAGMGATICLSGSTTPMPGCTVGMCTAYCTTVDCTTGTCIGPNTCECN